MSEQPTPTLRSVKSSREFSEKARLAASPARSRSSLSMKELAAAMNGNASNGGAPSPMESTNIKVAVRCRPLSAEEKKIDNTLAVLCNSEKSSVTVNTTTSNAAKKTSRSLEFDRIFGIYSTQQEVYETVVKPIVNEAINGFNCTVFAYGPTGTGKTYTMEGDLSNNETWGMIPRAAKNIFDNLSALDCHSSIKISFLEIYNEELRDLLSTTSNEKRLKLMEDLKRGVVCYNLEEFTVTNTEEVMEYLKRGVTNRQTAATANNVNSSRSHVIFTFRMVINTVENGSEVVKSGQVNFVDLAGSECVGRSGAKDERAREAGSINQSLLTLGRVITALVDYHAHIPYRDSKLTRLLQESLGGKAKTSIIATVSPSIAAAEESLFTVDFAYRARSIKNQPQNSTQTASKQAVKDYLAEIDLLRQQLTATRERNGVYMDYNEYQVTQAKLATQENLILECESTIRQRDQEIAQLRKEKFSLEQEVLNQSHTIKAVNEEKDALNGRYNDILQRLYATYVAWKGSEAVVVEQSDTEEVWKAAGTKLLRIIADRDADILNLIEKVQQLHTHADTRMHSSEEYADELQNYHSQLTKQIEDLIGLTNQQQAHLAQGIVDLTSDSNRACLDMQKSLESILQDLTRATDENKAVLTNQCGDTQMQLKSLNDTLVQKIQVMRGDWNSWFQKVNDALLQAQSYLDQQSQQCTTALAVVKSEHDQLVSLIKEQHGRREAQYQLLLQQSQAMRAQLQASWQQHDLKTKQQCEAAQNQISAKAQQLQKAVEDLAKDLINSTATMLGNLTTSSAALSAESLQLANDRIDSSDAYIQQQRQNEQQQLTDAQRWATAATDHVNQQIQLVASSRDNLHEKFTHDLRQTTQSLYTSTDNHFGESIIDTTRNIDVAKDFLYKLQETSKQTAEKVSAIVPQVMIHAANGCRQLGSLQSAELEKLRNVLQKDVAALQNAAQQHRSDLLSGKQRAAEHLQQLKAIVAERRASTPTAPVTEQVTFPATRDHEIIRTEVTTQHLQDREWQQRLADLSQTDF